MPSGRALAHLGAAAAQDGADAREQLARAEGLGEIVVGAELEAHHAVGLLDAAGEHDDRDRRLVAQAARERHAVLGLEPEVEHDKVHDLLGDYFAHRAAVGYGRNAQLVLPEIIGDQLPDGRVVVDRKHMRHCCLGRLGLHVHDCPDVKSSQAPPDAVTGVT